MANNGNVQQAELNGLRLYVDMDSGSIVRMSYPGPGIMLDTTADRASIVDVAYPVEAFEPLRLASRFSKQARVVIEPQSVTISWDRIGASRSLDLPGKVSATVCLKAAPDGQSVTMTCELTNHSEHSIRQVLFPDFFGLVPFAGEGKTLFRTGGSVDAPFRSLIVPDAADFYAPDSSFKEYTSGGPADPMIMRWMDLGSLHGGFSLFPKRWGWDPKNSVILRRYETDGKLRLMCAHKVDIGQGEKWNSGEFVLTPHAHGWAAGIEPYREWVKQNVKRDYPLPAHVRDGLGFRSIWMSRNQPEDPAGDAIFKISDLANIAEECKEHGLSELVPWGWHESFTLPFPDPYPMLGTKREFIKAVADCKKTGVNVAPFVSVVNLRKPCAEKYGLNPGGGGWTYHPELIPRMNPYYASRYSTQAVDLSNPLWQADVLQSCKALIDDGVACLVWDQFCYHVQKTPNLFTLASQIRNLAKAKDPESTFGGESIHEVELDCNYLDYTWDWLLYRDTRPFNSVFSPYIRLNCNVDTSPAVVKFCFADNRYINVWTRKPDMPNGSDYISNHPALSRALKQCAKLRARFLSYFVDGKQIGDCLLSQDAPPDAFVNCYVLPDRALLIAMNQAKTAKALDFKCDLAPWIKSPSGKYELRSYDGSGKLLSTTAIDSSWNGRTKVLQPLDMTLFEVMPKNGRG